MRPTPFRVAAVSSVALAGLAGGVFGGAQAQRPEPRVVAGVVDLTLVARAEHREAPSAWTGRARVASQAPVEPPEPAAGVCRRLAAPPPAQDGPVVDALRIGGPTRGELTWSEADAGWRTPGPQAVVDAAWGVGDLEIEAGGQRLRVEDAVRFGAFPEVTEVRRADDGSVRIAWDPATVDRARVVAAGPAGELECGTDGAAATLPWWSVPAVGGAVVLQNVRERVTVLPTGVVVRVRAVVERVVPLDAPPRPPAAAPAPAAPSLLAPPKGPRHSHRPPRPTFG